MKKLILAIGLMLSATTFAQTTNVNLSIRLFPIQTIEVNPAQANVDLDFQTKANYQNGVVLLQKNHLSVYSTGGFVVSVKSQDDLLTNGINSDNIQSSDIKVVASEGSANALTGGTYSPEVGLTTTPEPLFGNATGGINKNFNITYRAMGNADAYLNKHYNGQNPTVYSTTVVYEIVPN